MSEKRCLTPEEAVDEYFDMLIKSRFIEMFDECSCEAKLSEVCSSINRGKPAVYAGSSDYHIIGQACIRTDHIEFERTRFMEPSRFDREYVLRSGDVLVNSTGVGSLGRCCEFYNPDNGIYFTDSHVTILRLNTGIMNPIFLKHFLNQSKVQKELYDKCVNGSTNQIELNRAAFTKFPILKPSIELQNQFARFTEQVDKTKMVCKQIFQSFDNLVKSRFIEMFGDCRETIPIGEVCSLHSRIGWQALTKAEHMETGQYMLITGTDFKDGLIDFNNCRFVSKERFEMDPNIIIQEGDVLVTKDGTIGKVAVVKDLPKPATLNAGVFVVRNTDDQFLTEFIQQCLLSFDFQLFVENVKRGATIAHLNQGIFVNYELPRADLNLQHQFVDYVQQVDKSKFTVQTTSGQSPIRA